MTGCRTNLEDIHFVIQLSNEKAALEAAKQIKPGAWADSEANQADSLDKLLTLWGWTALRDESCVQVVSFSRPCGRIGDDELLFESLAPFAEDGSFLTLRGVEGKHYSGFVMTWAVKNGKFLFLPGVLPEKEQESAVEIENQPKGDTTLCHENQRKLI